MSTVTLVAQVKKLHLGVLKKNGINPNLDCEGEPHDPASVEIPESLLEHPEIQAALSAGVISVGDQKKSKPKKEVEPEPVTVDTGDEGDDNPPADNPVDDGGDGDDNKTPDEAPKEDGEKDVEAKLVEFNELSSTDAATKVKEIKDEDLLAALAEKAKFVGVQKAAKKQLEDLQKQ